MRLGSLMLLAAALALGLAPVRGRGQAAVHHIPADEVAITATSFLPVPRLEAASNEVQVDARVLDRQRRPVAGLKASDFEIADNGRPQVVTSFIPLGLAQIAPVQSPDTRGAMAGVSPTPPADQARAACTPAAEPSTVLLFFDDLSTENNDLAYARNQALQYLSRAECGGRLLPGEKIGVVTGSGIGDVNPSQDGPRLRAALQKVAPHPLAMIVGARCPLITPTQAFDIIYSGYGSDAALLAALQSMKCGGAQAPHEVRQQAEEVWDDAENQASQLLIRLGASVAAMAGLPGRRTIVLASSGFFTQEFELQRQQQLLIDAAVRAQVVIDGLDARGLTAPAPNMGAWNDPYLGNPRLDDWRMAQEAGGFSMRDSALWEIAESTGGDFFHDNNDLRGAYGNDIAGPAAYYGLGFVPAALKSDGAFHRLKVSVARPGLSVAARNGYFAPAANPNRHSPEEWQKLIREVMGSGSVRQIDLQVAATPAPGGVHLGLRLDPNTLKFRRQAGRHRANVTAIFALLSPTGTFVTGQRVELATQFRDSTLKDVSHPGVGIPLGVDLHAAPGGYRLRLVVLDDVGGALTAISGNLDIAKPSGLGR